MLEAGGAGTAMTPMVTGGAAPARNWRGSARAEGKAHTAERPSPTTYTMTTFVTRSSSSRCYGMDEYLILVESVQAAAIRFLVNELLCVQPRFNRAA